MNRPSRISAKSKKPDSEKAGPTMSSPSLGGSFLPNADYTIGGNWTFTNTPSIGSGAYVTTGATQTLTAKTLTAPTITGIVAGVPDLTLALGTSNVKFCSAQVDVSTSAALVNITGLTGFAVVASGVYRFDINISGTSGGSGGMKVAFKLTTTTLTDLEAMATGLRRRRWRVSTRRRRPTRRVSSPKRRP